MKISFSLNKVIRFLITSDLTLSAGWGFLAPIFAIFIDRIEGGDVMVAGFAVGLYWITKSIVQPFIARHLDRNHGEIDDFYYLVSGLFVTGLVPLGYLFVTLPWQLYILEFIHALAMACVVPTWAGIFTRHIDKGEEAFEWSIESTAIGFGAGIAGMVGGVLAEVFGFEVVFILVSMFTMFAVLILFPVRPLIMPKGRVLIRPEMKKPPFSHEKGAF
jgi:hypothetical protein